MTPCRLLTALFALALAACSNAIPDLQLPDSIHFEGLPYKSAPRSQPLKLYNSGSEPMDVALQVTGPFQINNTELHLEPRNSAILVVTFDPQTEGESTGTLWVRANGHAKSVALSASVMPPPDCGPPTTCGVPEFDPASQACVTRPIHDGEACGEGLVCYGGQCAGVEAAVGSACDTPCGSGTWTGDTCALPFSTRIHSLAGHGTSNVIDFRGLADDQDNIYWFEGPGLNLVSATRDFDVRYQVPIEGTPVGTLSLIAGDLLVTSKSAGGIEARRLADGSRAWRFPLSTYEVAVQLVAGDGVIYAQTTSGDRYAVVALSAASGQLLGRYDLPSGNSTRLLGLSQGNLYSLVSGGPSSATLTALRPDGVALWPAPVATTADGNFTFADLGDHVLLAGIAYNPADGSIAWQIPESHHPARVTGSTAYVIGDGSLSKLDARTGAVLWQRRSINPDAMPILTTRGVLLVGPNQGSLSNLQEGLQLSEVSANGRLLYQCILDHPATAYFTQDVVLLRERLVLSSLDGFGGTGYRLAVFPLPGVELAASGWVQNRGSPRQDGRSR